MATFTGTAGNENLSGSGAADIFRLKQGGDDTASGLAGDDTLYMGSSFTALDVLDGGADTDKVWLKGDYSAGVVFGATTMTNVEVLRLSGNFDHAFTTHDATVAAGARLTVNAAPLAGGHALTFDGSAETDGRFTFIASGGNDLLTGGARGDIFRLTRGGDDEAHGGAGRDTFHMGGSFDVTDRIDGGDGSDTLQMAGNFVVSFFFGEDAMTSIETLELAVSNQYFIFTADGNVAAGKTLTVNYSVAGGFLGFDGSAETDGHFAVSTVADNGVILTGGALSDTFTLTGPGDIDTLYGGGGDDVLNFGAALSGSDLADGGAGYDTLELGGKNYSGPLLAFFMPGIERVQVDAGFNYSTTIANDITAAGETFTFDGSALGAANTVTVDAGADDDSNFVFLGGAGNDSFTLGTGAGASNTVTGGGGADAVICDAAADTIVASVAESTGQFGHDILNGMDFDADKFDLTTTVTTADVSIVSIDSSAFDAMLTAASTGHFGAGAVLALIVTSGDQAGKIFLLVDGDGDALYQTGSDYLFELVAFAGGTLDTGDFI